MNKVSLGYSPCPNDTFMFFALTTGKIPLQRIHLSPPILADVETLNQWALEARLDVTKLSFHALGHVLKDYRLLNSGAALGRGCGPLLVTTPDNRQPLSRWRIALPGQYTTAALLLRLYAPHCHDLVHLRFDRIMTAIHSGEVDGGVIIHEGRFTYKNQGLCCHIDLGLWWEQTTNLPLPLGAIAVRRTLTTEESSEIEEGIRRSIHWARTHPEDCATYIKKHAQELANQVISSHINLYVNAFSLDLGEEGRMAVQELLARGHRAGIFPASGLNSGELA